MCWTVPVEASGTYRAGLPQHSWVDVKGSPEDQLRYNLDIYKQHAATAAEQNVQIIVFPEFGLIPSTSLNSGINACLPFMEVIPDPLPGTPTDRSTLGPVASYLSELAHTHQMLVVANVNELCPCTPK
eukprot:Colp12_sorted_trinity150504_noHs@19031